MSDKPPGIWRKFFFRFLLLTLALFVAVLSVRWNCDPDSIGTGWLFGAICAIAGTTILWAAFLFIRWLCCWRNCRKFLIGVACFAMLVVLFYAEENWRGKRAWENYKREREAKGEKFKLTELAPPPVPDDQNFAMTPIVASCYSGIIDRHGRALRPANTNIINRLQMDYCSYGDPEYPTNTGGNWQKCQPTNLKVWQEYYRKLAARTNLFAVPTQPQTPAADVLLALSKYDSAIEELRQASLLPCSRFPLAYDLDNPALVLFPHLAGLKSLAQVLKLRAAAELQLGQTEKALEDVKLSLRLTDSIRNEPLLINHLVHIALFQIVLTPIWEGLAEHRWTDAQLAELQRELQTMDFLTDYQFSLRGERAYALGTIDYFRQQQKFRELAQSGVWMMEDDSSTICIPESIRTVGYYLMPSGWFDQNELAIAKFHQQWLLPITSPENHLVSPQINAAAEKYLNAMPSRPWSCLSELFLSALDMVGKKAGLSQNALDLARVAIALERYRLAHGSYPESLAALTPQFIAQVPHDVIGGQPLHYRRTDDPPSQSSGETGGQFILYSVGWNEKDDNGVVGLRPSGTVDIEKGDWVWRYPAN